MGLLTSLGIDSRRVVFSGSTSEEQGREYGRGRGTVDCCHPVKCMSGHYGELVFGQRHKLDILLSPMIATLPSSLAGGVADTLSCPRVMAAPGSVPGWVATAAGSGSESVVGGGTHSAV